MARVTPTLQNFTSGELSPKLAGRYDLGSYFNGCAWQQNFISTVQGPAHYRDGLVFAWNTRNNAIANLIDFEFNTEQAYVLEVGDQYMRFYTDHGIVMNGTVPLEVATPWVAADLVDADGNSKLRSVQSGDILYITQTDGDYQPQKLTRSGALS